MNYDLAIATATYFGEYTHVDAEQVKFRRKLFHDLTASLAKTDWCNKKVVWVVYDDHSAEPEVPEVPWGDVVFFHQPTGPSKSASNNVIACLNKAATLAPLTVVIDSDCLVNPRWLRRGLELIDEFPGAPGYGLFNTRFHPIINYNDFVSEDPSLVFKHTTTICGLLFRSADRGQVEITSTSWCEAFVYEILPFQVSRIFPVCKPSLIQHCGTYGLNSTGTVTDFDPEFVP